MSSSSSLFTRQPTFNSTIVDCFPHMSMQSSVDYEEDDRKGDIYDPFSPTDGDKERRMEEEEEEEGEKYDPFDPTGSPASDVDDDIGKEGEMDTNVEVEVENEDKEEEPPDSTDTLTDQLSPCRPTQLPQRRRMESSAPQAEGQKESGDSDHSEIEEGEIVTALDKDGIIKRPAEKDLSPNSPRVSFFGSKPERILRVLDGDGFVSVCTEGTWEDDRELEDEPAVGVEDLRRKLVSQRKERYRSFPVSSPLSSQPPLPPSVPQASISSSPPILPVEQIGKNNKSSKSSTDPDQQKVKEKKAGDKEGKRKKRRKEKEKEGETERSKEPEHGHKAAKEVKTRRSRSNSRKRKKRRHSSPEASHNSFRRSGRSRRSFSSQSEEKQREREREKERDRNRDRDKDRERGRSRDRDQNRHHHCSSSHRKDERVRDSSSRKRERERTDRHSRSRERGLSKRSRRSGERRDDDRERPHDRGHRRDGRPVVPPSIQDLNGSDLFAIKRTITVTTTTTTTVPGSPRLSKASPSHPTQGDDLHKRKKRKWVSADAENQESCRSRSQSQSPSRYHGYESDRYSDKLEIDMLSLDGEALDSDYPSLEDTPPAGLPPEPPVPSPKTKVPPKTRRNHPKKKSHALKKSVSSSSSDRTTSKCLSSLTVTSGSTSISPGLSSAKRGRKLGKDKDSRKDLSRSGKSKKDGASGRKGKLQSKVSVLVREGVTSTTGSSVGSGKLSMDLLGSGGTGGGAGGSVVGGSIAVVFCRDNESRSPFLKPCSEPLSLGGRSKDLSSLGKRSSLAAPPLSLSTSAALKSKKTKTGSITSTSSSASSPSSSLATKRRRRLAKKTSKKGGGAGDSSQSKPSSEGWGGGSLDVQSAVGEGSKSVSPNTVQAGPPPCSSSSSTSSSTSALPPSSSPQHSPPPSTAPLRDTRESSPDSQTVDSSCKTPDPSFLAEDCPTQTSPVPPASSPSTPQGAGLNLALSTPTAKAPPPDDASKNLASPPCSSSSAGLTSFSLPLSSSDLSSSSSVSSSSASKLPPPPPPPPPPPASALPWSLQTGVDCTTGGVLARTFKATPLHKSEGTTYI